MNAVEIEEAVSGLALEPFDAGEFPFAFLAAFGNKKTTIKRLRSGNSNSSDIEHGVLQRNHIHIATCDDEEVDATLAALRESTKTTAAKAKFILATDGETLQAEDLTSGETIACEYDKFPDHFGFFLPLAGITTVKQIRESSFDIRATSRLNRLYVELLKDNPDWATAERRPDMNHFMARLIFCFFAEDTDIFNGDGLFTATVDQMSERDASNTHEVIGEIFRAMDTKLAERDSANIPRWADGFPYVNGELFSGSTDAPHFSRIARSYLLHIGNLDWTKINPDIFGSMIQAVADDEERGALGMHYTSVPNILKVLNPLFLDDLQAQLDAAGDNGRKLLNLRNRMAKIRVFDPACGSGNFLVIAYKEVRAIEAVINEIRGEPERRSDIPLTNFRGIELRDFPAEIARLALIIAEYQCDVTYRGQQEALAEFLPLDSKNWITCDNALRIDWMSVCPPTGTTVKLKGDDLFNTPLDQSEIDFENEGGETYICGNPPYKGSQTQGKDQKEDLKAVFSRYGRSWKQLDYVAGWLIKAAEYAKHTPVVSAFVCTNSICQGRIVPILWPVLYGLGQEIVFGHTSFKWSNLASHNAGVTVAIVGISNLDVGSRKLFAIGSQGLVEERQVDSIGPYLVPNSKVIVEKRQKAFHDLPHMQFGNMPIDGGNLLLSRDDLQGLELEDTVKQLIVRRNLGAAELNRGKLRYCLWISDEHLEMARTSTRIAKRIDAVRLMREASSDVGTNEMAKTPHQFREMHSSKVSTLILPRVSSERRNYFPVDLIDALTVPADSTFALYDAPTWNLSIVASQLHLMWIATVCGKLKTDFRYSNTLGWNTFPVPRLTEQNKADLTKCAEDILLAREAHFPATIADLYNPEDMPDNLRRAHEANDEVLERIYIGRRFKNDTERLEKLFELYTKMTGKASGGKAAA